MQFRGRFEYDFTRLACWLLSDGAKADGVSERLRRYHAAAKARFDRGKPDWFDDFLARRDWCSICGESFRLENLSLCTHCETTLGYCHMFEGGRLQTATSNARDARWARWLGKLNFALSSPMLKRWDVADARSSAKLFRFPRH